jgi:hypothetical protein
MRMSSVNEVGNTVCGWPAAGSHQRDHAAGEARRNDGPDYDDPLTVALNSVVM